jgi:hypothetical protein
MIVRRHCSTTAILISFAALITLLALPLTGPLFGQDTGQQNRMSSQAALPGPSDDVLAKLESVYKDIHANPKLSMQERRTAGIHCEHVIALEPLGKGLLGTMLRYDLALPGSCLRPNCA